jgi:hypothetical protein
MPVKAVPFEVNRNPANNARKIYKPICLIYREKAQRVRKPFVFASLRFFAAIPHLVKMQFAS